MLEDIPAHPNDWLILAGDVANGRRHLDWCFEVLCGRFRQVVWTPGNHDLWSRAGVASEPRGMDLYHRLVEIARQHGVLTPEDPYPVFSHATGDVIIAPLFLHFDYSFRPGHVHMDDVVKWALDANVIPADERLLHSDPFPDHQSWCAWRCAVTDRRLASCGTGMPKVLVNHYPLEESLAVLPRVPRFCALVRNPPLTRLARSVQCLRRDLWPSSYPRHRMDGRGAFPGSVAGLSGTMGARPGNRSLPAGGRIVRGRPSGTRSEGSSMSSPGSGDAQWWRPYASCAGVEILHVDLTPNESHDRAALAWLDGTEYQRWQRFRVERARRQFSRCRAVLRVCLCERLGCRNDQLEFGAGKYGKPYAMIDGQANEAAFNVSHSPRARAHRVRN